MPQEFILQYAIFSATTYSNFILKEMSSTRKSTSVIMTSPHFLTQGQSCFPDEQPGHGEPSHEESAGDSASHTEIGRKGDKSVWQH